MYQNVEYIAQNFFFFLTHIFIVQTFFLSLTIRQHNDKFPGEREKGREERGP